MKKSIRNILLVILTIITCFSFACAGKENSDNATTLNVLTTEYVLYTGGKTSIKASYDGDEDIKYVCADQSIATVSDSGEITGVSAGVTFIDVIADDQTICCMITVKEGGYSVNLGYEEIILVVGGNKTFTATPILNGSEYDTSVQFSITNSENGNLIANGNSATFTANKVGVFVLTAKTDNAESSCTIKVISKTATRLAQPTVSIENCKILRWNSVEGAQSYAVSIGNGSWIKTNSTQYDVSEFTNQMILNDEIRLFVKAVSDNDSEHIDSYITNMEFSHKYVGVETKEATCFIQGAIEYTCSVCDKKYANENYIEEHEYESGRCVKCKTYQTEGIVYSWDDELKCYYVSSVADATLEKAFVAGTYQDSEHGEAPVSYIGEFAFSGCTMLTHVVLPESVKSIKKEAFYGAEKLKVVIMPGVEKLTEEDDKYNNNQFLAAYGLETVVVKKDFSNVNQAFVGIKGNKFDRDKVNFYVMEKDGNVKLTHHDTGTEGLCTGNVYYYDEELSLCSTWRFAENGYDIEMNENDHIFVKEECALCGKYNDYGIKYEFDSEKACYYVAKNQSYLGDTVKIVSEYNDGYNGVYPVKYVGASAFADNTNIIKVEMPNSVTTIGKEAFYKCTGLETVIMPGVEYIGVNEGGVVSCRQFYDCTSLKTVVVGESFTLELVTERGPGPGDNRCFYTTGTTGQVGIYLTSEAGAVSLYGVGSTNNMLSNDRVYNLNETEKDICGMWKWDENGEPILSANSSHNYEGNVCLNCGTERGTAGLTYELSSDGESYYVSAYSGSDTEVIIPSTTYEGLPVTGIKASAFVNKSSITKVVMPESVTTIGKEAFYQCTSLETVIMPGVEYIGVNAGGVTLCRQFYGCTSLKTVVVGESFTLELVTDKGAGDNRCFYTTGTTGQVGIYLTSEAGTVSLYGVGSTNNMLSNDKIYYQSKTRPTDETKLAVTWTYVDGVPTLWSNIPEAE